MRSQGELKVTASIGVAATPEGDQTRLIAAADAALYTAKRAVKDRTVRGGAAAAEILRDPVPAAEPEV